MSAAPFSQVIGTNIPDWVDEGRCGQADPEAYFPKQGESTRYVKSICNGREAGAGGSAIPPRPVRDQCLQYALDNDERWGVWGGLSEGQRARLKRGRNAA